MKRNVLNSPRLSELKRRRQRAFFNKLTIYVGAIVVAVALLTYLSRLSGINIQSIEVGGNKIVDAEKIKSVIVAEISGYYLWLFPKTNALFYPKTAIKESLAQAFLRLREINLIIKNNEALVVSLVEREPLFTWCGFEPPADLEEEKCYFMDEDGYIFDEAPYFSGNVYFKFYGQNGIEIDPPLGNRFAPEYFYELTSFKTVLEDMSIEPKTLNVKLDGDIEIALSGTSGKILIRADIDPENKSENLSAALETEPLKTRFKKEYSKLEYIDLRFGNKVYSKFTP